MDGPLHFEVEYSQRGDRYHDYCLWEYDPLADTGGKLRSINLLRHSFALAGDAEPMESIVAAIREGYGPGRTVWGVKRVGDRLSWEFYFYDYARIDREGSVSRLLDILRPFIRCDLKCQELSPYFMFSIDLDGALTRQEKNLDEINIYIGNVGSSVSSGICYALTAGGLELHNFYFFFNAATEREDIVGKICSSAHLNLPRLDIDEILWPEMATCQTIVVANKKHNDGIYFSRITIDQLILFLERTRHPLALVRYISDNRDKLDHMLYDAGMDYIMDGDHIRILKTSYYGVF